MGIWDLDVASGLVTWTPETAAIFGIPLDEFDGKLETIGASSIQTTGINCRRLPPLPSEPPMIS
jgi:hypothetical protein